MERSRVVHVIVPDAIDDPARPSGGNYYDRRICAGLSTAGWRVHEHAVPDAWPGLGAAGRRATARIVEQIRSGAVVLVDGLIASSCPEIFAGASTRLAVVVLLHQVDAARRAGEEAMLRSARAVITTSRWARDAVLMRHPEAAVHIAEPGVDPAALAIGTPSGAHLLCVAAVARHKGHDVLVDALAELAARPWWCTLAGPLDRDRAFVTRLRSSARAAGIADRLRFTGPLTRSALQEAYCSADVLVHPTRGETYGMVVTEALAHGLPVIAAAAGGVPATLGTARDGVRPGILVAPDDAAALAAALGDWLTDAELRHTLRRAALARSCTLRDWTVTTAEVARVLTAAAA